MSRKKKKQTERSLLAALTGRTFVNPVFDYMLIGGGLSLVIVVVVSLNSNGANFVSIETLPYFFLLSNSAHFAASTVRLYTKPGAYQSMPFVSMALPLVALLLLTAFMFRPDAFGLHLTRLYLTWSPYHYAAQAYGLCVMYSYRSGCILSGGNKKLLWWVSMVPFFYTFAAGEGGVNWLVPGLMKHPIAMSIFPWFRNGMLAGALGTIVFVFWRIWNSEDRPLPIISILLLISNAIWFFVLPSLDAFLWATIFHGIQYLAIVIYFHVKDQLARPDNRHGPMFHIVWFYAVCLLLGYGMFSCFPRAYTAVGFGPVESIMLVTAMINIHHFIVDAYIWRLKKSDTNRTIVDSSATVPVST